MAEKSEMWAAIQPFYVTFTLDWTVSHFFSKLRMIVLLHTLSLTFEREEDIPLNSTGHSIDGSDVTFWSVLHAA